MHTSASSRAVPPPGGPWSAALLVAAPIAVAEGIACLLLYRDLPMTDPGKFLLFFVTGYTAAAALLGGALARLLSLRLPFGWSVTVGVGPAWMLILNFMMLRL